MKRTTKTTKITTTKTTTTTIKTTKTTTTTTKTTKTTTMKRITTTKTTTTKTITMKRTTKTKTTKTTTTKRTTMTMTKTTKTTRKTTTKTTTNCIAYLAFSTSWTFVFSWIFWSISLRTSSVSSETLLAAFCASERIGKNCILMSWIPSARRTASRSQSGVRREEITFFLGASWEPKMKRFRFAARGLLVSAWSLSDVLGSSSLSTSMSPFAVVSFMLCALWGTGTRMMSVETAGGIFTTSGLGAMFGVTFCVGYNEW